MIFGFLRLRTRTLRKTSLLAHHTLANAGLSVIASIYLPSIAITALTIPGYATAATAQEQETHVRISHQPTEPHQLPPAGTLIPIVVQLVNSSDVDTKIRLVGSRDGRYMDIAYPLGVLDVRDQPTYSILVPAPVAAMSYQFIIHQKSGDLTLTEKFTVKRHCIQTYKVEVPEGLPSTEYRRKVGTLVSQARSLERDTKNLDTAIQLLEELKKDLEE